MSADRPITVAVDAMGGDHGPDEIIAGVTEALSADAHLDVVLLGPAEVVEPVAALQPGRVRPLQTSQTIEMGEHPATAVRTKKDSSIVVGCRLVREGEADAFFSAGSTGAVMAAATLVMGRIKGVQRPAIAATLPTAARPVVLLDVGANADCKPEYLLQFAHMGAAYSSAVLGVEQPAISLLNIGEEPTKGSQLAIKAHALLSGAVTGFSGNIEGRDVLAGETDVIVTDGFTGNVTLKLLEGTSRILLGQVKSALTASAASRLAAALAAGRLRDLKARLDPDTYGGAPLLGVSGVCIIGHGSSRSRAVANAIGASARAARNELTRSIAERIAVGGTPQSTPA